MAHAKNPPSPDAVRPSQAAVTPKGEPRAVGTRGGGSEPTGKQLGAFGRGLETTTVDRSTRTSGGDGRVQSGEPALRAPNVPGKQRPD